MLFSGRERQRGAVAEAELARAAQRQRSVDARAADTDAAARAGVFDGDPIRSRAQDRVAARHRGIAQHDLGGAIAADDRGQPADAAPGFAGDAQVDAAAAHQPRVDAARQLLRGRPFFDVAEQVGEGERGAALARRQQRVEPAHGVDRFPARLRARLLARQRRFHVLEVADGAPGVARACVLSQLLVGQGGAPVIAAGRQQRRRAFQRPALELGQRRPAAAREQRLRRRQPQRPHLVCLSRARVLGRHDVGERVGQQAGRRVDVGQRYERQAALAVADRAEHDGQRRPAALAAQPSDQADEVAAAEDRQLGIEHVASRSHG